MRSVANERKKLRAHHTQWMNEQGERFQQEVDGMADEATKKLRSANEAYKAQRDKEMLEEKQRLDELENQEREKFEAQFSSMRHARKKRIAKETLEQHHRRTTMPTKAVVQFRTGEYEQWIASREEARRQADEMLSHSTDSHDAHLCRENNIPADISGLC